jgi:UDP:flavonoid glycosyltransferase YjiC (YdhE family)
VRILFAFAGGQGHFDPLVPLARAAAAAGHEVAFAGRAEMLDAIRDAGFHGVASPGGAPDPAARMPLKPYDRAAEERVLREWYAGALARDRAEALAVIAGEWGPDRIVRDEVDVGARAAAERLGIPGACVLVTAAAAFGRGIVERSARELVLSPFPASLRHEPGAFAYRAGDPPLAGGDAVYLTLGTVFNAESGDLLGRALEGVKAVGAPVVVTTGRQVDPAELGHQPGVRIQRWIPLEELLPWCRAVVSHGGSGSVLGALAHGLPSVLLPVGADQPLTAALVQDLGAGIALDPLTATPEDIAAAVRQVITDPAFGAAARRVREEIRALPAAADALARLA